MKSSFFILILAVAGVWWLMDGGDAKPAVVVLKPGLKIVTAQQAEARGQPSAFASVSQTYNSKFGDDTGRSPSSVPTATNSRVLTMVDNSISRITDKSESARVDVRESMRTHGVPDNLIEELFQREDQASQQLGTLQALERRLNSAEFNAREDELFQKHTEWIYSNISPYFAE